MRTESIGGKSTEIDLIKVESIKAMWNVADSSVFVSGRSSGWVEVSALSDFLLFYSFIFEVWSDLHKA